MKITEEMLQAATAKAVELGVLPRRVYADDFATNAELMHEILQAALHTASNKNGEAEVTA